MEVTLGIVFVDSFLIEESALLQLRLIQLLANQHQLCFLEMNAVVVIDWYEASLATLILFTARHTTKVCHLLLERLIHNTEGKVALFVNKLLSIA